MQDIRKARSDLLQIFESAVEAVGGRSTVKEHLEANPIEGTWSWWPSAKQQRRWPRALWTSWVNSLRMAL
ncbi:hypothetical protein [Solemya velesiana gill symbiont]|uniref:hypothetical protein n=1 Tax=Solemya velesiana gill symbiont TaxID=1918948 RepID=UPI001FE875D1|nr:hypothetical protein [Solemya velesiana gill symbiont]